MANNILQTKTTSKLSSVVKLGIIGSTDFIQSDYPNLIFNLECSEPQMVEDLFQLSLTEDEVSMGDVNERRFSYKQEQPCAVSLTLLLKLLIDSELIYNESCLHHH